jgi:hypothetical protein
MSQTRADKPRDLSKFRASLATISDHITPLTTVAHAVLRFVGDAEDHGY